MNLKMYIISVVVSGLFIACKSANLEQSQSSKKNSVSEKEMKHVERTNKAPDDTHSQIIHSVIQNTNGNTGGNANIIGDKTDLSAPMTFDNNKLYQDIMMSKDQIREFETAMERFKEKQRNSPNGEMMGTIPSERDRQLGRILSSDQLKKYEIWKSNNP
ncbi:hypothetical protein KO529_14150 [Arenibacter algicola]|uniref:hypothetical protein n=1 Tax=Arenibacter algicola TaxID=616991 RepID=UPI001C07BF36|nr:hypothetical protein [Arenibacter algicola]MBU2905937.1 hypothetical protein [Arenibacter algicola]